MTDNIKTEMPIEVQIKLDAARQVELSIERLAGYENVFNQMSIDYAQVTMPSAIRKRFKDWVESQIIIERANIHSYGK